VQGVAASSPEVRDGRGPGARTKRKKKNNKKGEEKREKGEGALKQGTVIDRETQGKTP